MLTKIKLTISAIILVALGFGSFSIYSYVNNLNNQIIDLTETNERLHTETKTLAKTLDEQTLYVDELVNDIHILHNSKTELEKKLKANEIDIKSKVNVINKLNEEMLIRKSKMLEDRINKGTKKVFDEIEGVFKNE